MARGVHGNPRGDDVATFGPDVTERFCEREMIDLVIRSHQYVPEGYKVMHSGHLITLFSARDYLEQHRFCASFRLFATVLAFTYHCEFQTDGKVLYYQPPARVFGPAQ